MKEYDLIVMNPPFNDGEKHLLKAIDMQSRNGGAIVCLLNAETVRNPYSNDRKLLVQKLNEYNAEIEYLENAFADAERKTYVEIALIRVVLPEVERISVIFEQLEKAQEHEEFKSENNKLIENDFIKAIVKQYQLEVAAGVKLINEYNAMKPYILSSFKKDPYLRDSYTISIKPESVNKYIEQVRYKYWDTLFHNKEFIGRLTGNLQQEFHSKVKELTKYEFSLYNIYELKLQMLAQMVKGVEDTILSLFDELSYEHSYYDEYSKNIHYYNGWKTNKAYIINNKVIIPLPGYDDLWKRFRLDSYQVLEKLSDIEKCFDFLDGQRTCGVNLVRTLEYATSSGTTRNIHLKYFDVTFYKKGTCHITFTNDELLKKFNIFGSQRKGWLPPAYGKKAYKDMSEEEKQVIDEFEGVESYNETVRNSDYFICEGNSLDLLSA